MSITLQTERPLTAPEIAAWVEGLGRNDRERIVTIRQLIKNRVGDKMSASDLLICRKELNKLEDKIK